ncbi:MAG: hypothetical protein ACRDD4_11060 [Culicoidibacterales bacterium]
MIVTSLYEYLQYIVEAHRVENINATKKQLQKLAKQTWAERVEQTFFCQKNSDIVLFLQNRAADNDYHHATRTFLVFDQAEEILGFFTLSIKIVDISEFDHKTKKNYIYSGKSPNNVTHIPTILIAQLGKNDRFSEIISGDQLMEYALEKIDELRLIIGTKIVLLDSVNHPKVLSFYRSFGFVEFGAIISEIDESLQPMFLDVSK